MMKKILVICGLIFIANSAHAQIPSTDYVKLARKIQENMYDMMKHEVYKKIFKSKFDNSGVISEMKIDNDSNVYANLIVRMNQAKTDVSNLEILEKSSPGINSSGSMIASIEDSCEISNRKSQLSINDNSYVSKKSEKTGSNSKSIEELQQQIIDRAFGNEGKKSASGKLEIGLNDPTDPYYLMTGEGAALTLSPTQKQTMIDYIDLISPPFVNKDDKTNMKDIDDRYPIREMVDESLSGISRDVLQRLLAKRIAGPSGFSQLTALQSFTDEYFTGANTDDGSVAQKISTSELAIPDVIFRNMAVMKAYQVHISLLKFKSSLQRESMLAIKFANKLR
jgi:hypothetical protein